MEMGTKIVGIDKLIYIAPINSKESLSASVAK